MQKKSSETSILNAFQLNNAEELFQIQSKKVKKT